MERDGHDHIKNEQSNRTVSIQKLLTCMRDLTEGWKTRLWFSKNDLIRGWGYEASLVTSPVSSRLTERELFIMFSSLFSNVSKNGPTKDTNQSDNRSYKI